ncbi:GH3 auxin-responsive promoter-domain-containing protein [Infundibulicybe gibba]|nr:GH3 auxin-responsive promoter-domain-containing protein [Infundibulicybe gibba]
MIVWLGREVHNTYELDVRWRRWYDKCGGGAANSGKEPSGSFYESCATRILQLATRAPQSRDYRIQQDRDFRSVISLYTPYQGRSQAIIGSLGPIYGWALRIVTDRQLFLTDPVAQQVEQLKQRICGTLSYIVNTNSRTVYFLDAPLLARYRTELRLDASHNSVPIPGAGKSEVDFRMSIPEVHGPTKCAVFSLRYTHTLDVLDGAQRVVKAIPFSIVSAGDFRSCNGWEIENDVELIKTRLSGHVTPVAVAFIKPYYTFLLMHALFAIGERSLTTFNMIFITVFFDLAHLRPRPDRAKELRKIGYSVCIERGVDWGHLQPESGDNLYKIETTNDVFEYLDVERPESAEYITQAWNLEVGKKYEVVLTTRDGLWRYRLGDVLEIAGFAPEDGSPLIRFLERRSAVMRVALEFVTEAELREAVRSIEDDIGRVVEFSVVIDDRWFPRRYGFLLELESGLEPENAGPRAHAAPRRLQEYLSSTNSTFARFSSDSVVPVVEDRGLWKWGGQMKVPTVVYNPEMKDWLIGNVVQELGDGLRKIT